MASKDDDKDPQVKVLTRAEAEALLEEAKGYLADDAVTGIEIADQTDYEIFAESLAEVKTLYKKMEEQKQSALGPLNQAVSVIRSWFKPTQDKLLATEAALKKEMGAYVLAKENERKEALRLTASASQAGNGNAALLAIAKVESARVDKAEGNSYRFTYDVEIVDVDLLPDEWWTPDEGALTRYVRATNGQKPVAGCVIHKRPIISQKT